MKPAVILLMELPPRTRRIHPTHGYSSGITGTTSAYAENTGCTLTGTQFNRNYLRVRGEYTSPTTPTRSNSELPPRTRRIRHNPICVVHKFGTTSAYAENTSSRGLFRGAKLNYLRVRGEYSTRGREGDKRGELPPRTRRIHEEFYPCWKFFGTTSAYAENTNTTKPLGTELRNYLRVRGEYSLVRRSAALTRELPPRTRRIL